MTEPDKTNINETSEQPQASEVIEVTPNALPKRSSRRTFLLVALGVGGVALLGGAAYAAGKLMSPATSMDKGDGGIVLSSSGPAGSKQFKMPPIKNAPEIPAQTPDVMGLFLRRQDQSIFIGTGNIKIAAMRDSSGQSDSSAEHDGPEVEVVVNHNTAMYIDKTPITQEAMESGAELQQVVEPVESLDDLTANLSKTDTLSVWGEKSGSRVVAKVLLYRSPMMLKGG